MMALFLLAASCEEGVALFRQGALEPARQALEQVAQKSPSAFCIKSLGIVYAALGDYRRAEPPLGSACRMSPNEPDACYYWARALYALDRFAESLAALDRAPLTWRVATARGQALDALGLAKAEPTLQQAIELRRRDPAPIVEPDPLLVLGQFLYREGRVPEALALLRSAPADYRRLPAYSYLLGRALAQQEQWGPAAEALGEAVALRPNYAEAHGLLSRVYFRLGRPELAAEHSRLALQGSTTSK
jgi:tetratricopeptide (TPR) repeat protein